MSGQPATPIVILTGPIRSGKTTALCSWISDRRAAGTLVGGVLAPVVNGHRYLRSIATGEERLLDVPSPDVGARDLADGGRASDPAGIVAIGPHRFYADVFAWARERVLADREAVERSASGGWIVIDEVGPLELGGGGLEPAVTEAVRVCVERGALRLVLVVRDRLLRRVVEHYRLPEAIVAVVGRDELSGDRSSI